MLVDIAVERVEQRAARALLSMVCHLSETKLRGRVGVSATLSRRDFSEMIGTTLETAVRILSEFRRRGLISERDCELIAFNEPALRILANQE
jgi:CRP-like cAMP-binding protein